MGYTHYWNIDKKIEPHLVKQAGGAMARIVQHMIDLGGAGGAPALCGWNGMGKPQWAEQAGIVAFNGCGDEAHESFVWEPDKILEGIGGYDLGSPGQAFWFCKTAQKPYDPVVVACLFAAQQVCGDFIAITSDASDWQEFIGEEQSQGWLAVNNMLGHPTSLGHVLSATDIYERVFATKAPEIPAFGARISSP